MIRAPILTILFCGLAGVLALLPPQVQAGLYFDRQHLAAGHWIGLLSGHWLHADTAHLAWNVIALLVLGSLVERQSRRLLAGSILAGTAGVDLLLLSPLSELARYCGLSGVLNSLLGVALFLQWRETRSWTVLPVALLCILKIAVEIALGQSLFTDISWPPYAPAHLAGLLATPVALLAGCVDTVNRRKTTTATGTRHGHLVTGA